MANKINSTLLLLCAIGLLLAGAVAQERRTKIKAPPAVQKTVNEQSQGGTIRGFSKEVENGRTQYELELTVNGHARDMIIDPTGAILEVEEEITLYSLSRPVRAEVEKSMAGEKSGLGMGTDGKLLPKEKKSK